MVAELYEENQEMYYFYNYKTHTQLELYTEFFPRMNVIVYNWGCSPKFFPYRDQFHSQMKYKRMRKSKDNGKLETVFLPFPSLPDF